MATPYLLPAPIGDDSPIEADARAAGIADAYDERAAGTTLDELAVRLDHLTEALPDLSDTHVSYALGYASAVLSIRLAAETTTAAQTAAAFTTHEKEAAR